MMLTVACLLRSGGIYTPEWVEKLQRGVKRHLTVEHRFVCLSDIDVPCERIPLIHHWPFLSEPYQDQATGWTVCPRWWSKIELFRLGLFSGPVLYLDLDTIPIASLDDLARYPHKFTVVEGMHGYLNSTVMAWEGDYNFLYTRFCKRPMEYVYKYDVQEPAKGRIGDQAFIEDALAHWCVKPQIFQKLFKGCIVPYRTCVAADGSRHETPRARIVYFQGHGDIKVRQMREGVLAEQWV